MRRRVLYVVAWALATVLTVGASWLGIRSVLTAAAPGRALPLSAAELRRVAPTTNAPEPPSAAPSPPHSESPAPSDAPASPAAVSPSAKPSPSIVDVWVPGPDGHGGTAFRRTFRTSGGDVVVLAARNDVKIVSSTPKPGFAVNTSRAAPDAVTVTFTAPRRVCRVSARWMNGPYAEVGEVAGYGP